MTSLAAEALHKNQSRAHAYTHTRTALLSRAADVYGGYKDYAFPHDELRPLSRTHTDSLVELGATSPTRAGYSGVALTLIDSLDTLAILGNVSEFVWAVRWIGENVSFDLDIEVSASHRQIWQHECTTCTHVHTCFSVQQHARAQARPDSRMDTCTSLTRPAAVVLCPTGLPL